MTLKDDEAKLMRGDDDDDEAEEAKKYIVYWYSFAVAMCNARLRLPLGGACTGQGGPESI